MSALSARSKPSAATARQRLLRRGIDAATLKQCRRVVLRALRDGKPMRRDRLYAALDAAGTLTLQPFRPLPKSRLPA